MKNIELEIIARELEIFNSTLREIKKEVKKSTNPALQKIIREGHRRSKVKLLEK